jgi:hypothetical protein
VFLARAYAVLGNSDKAFEQMEKAYAKEDHRFQFLQTYAEFDGLRDDRRYADMVKRIGFAGK